MSKTINPMQKLHSSQGSEIELGNLRVPDKEIIEDESVVNYSSDTTCNENRSEKKNADLNTGSDAISNGVATRHPYCLLLSIVFAILIFIVSGALLFYRFQHPWFNNELQVELLTPRTVQMFCEKNEGTSSYYVTDLTYYNKRTDLDPHFTPCLYGGVVGGDDVEPPDFPHQVYFAASKVKCGGSILNEDFVLTAAHCFFTSNGTWRNSSCRWRVVGGDTDLNKTEGTEQIRNISAIYTHPGFRSGSPLDDIALVKLSRPFKITKFVQSPFLPTQNFSLNIPYYSALYVSGYGDLSYKGARPTILQKASLSIYTTSECQAAYAGEGIEIKEKMICAGAAGRDSCQGDSGGPLSFKRCASSDFASVLVGVVSGGIECGGEEYPGIYTKVSEYVDWIQNSIENGSIWS